MKIHSAAIYTLKIPFVQSFNHFKKARKFSDSVVVRLTTDDGVAGYGEGMPRSYVTGESVETCVEYIKKVLWSAILKKKYRDIKIGIDPVKALSPISDSLPDINTPGVISNNSAIGAVELALIDCLLKRQKISLAALLLPKRRNIIYSGIIDAKSVEKAEQYAKYYKKHEIKNIKIKISKINEEKRIAIVRNIVGTNTSLRLDANGAYNSKNVVKVLSSLEKYNIKSIEQPILRGDSRELLKVKKQTTIPVMADESLVTFKDAKALIKYKACDYFNLRISKCGGISKTIAMARLAKLSGVRLQLGCHVGETAILSATGRFLAAYIDNLDFVEGSFGKLLLKEDISKEDIKFGHGGKAPLLAGHGFGINVQDKILNKYAKNIIKLTKN